MIQIPRGTEDVLPQESAKWQYIENKLRSICQVYNYQEIRTPVFEHTELFVRGVGDTTDIVSKEMYTFLDKSERSLSLRPEGTAGVVRSFVENKLYADPQPTKLFYIEQMFRYERPKSGRLRQFTQFGVEAIGTNNPLIDAEVIALAYQALKEFGLNNLRLEINSVGCPVCRPRHREELKLHLHEVKDELCEDCQARYERNPMRILDCKNEKCQTLTKDAPKMSDYLCDDCQRHHANVKKYLDIMSIPYVENPRMVRGLDYYTQTAFEILEEKVGDAITILGGGRYNGLIQEVSDGKVEMSGIGFAVSIERILLALKENNLDLPLSIGIDCYIAPLGEQAKTMAAQLAYNLRQQGFIVEQDFLDKKLKGQIKAADRLKAKYILIIGDEEIAKEIIIVKDLATGEQEEVGFTELVKYFSNKIKRGDNK